MYRIISAGNPFDGDSLTIQAQDLRSPFPAVITTDGLYQLTSAKREVPLAQATHFLWRSTLTQAPMLPEHPNFVSAIDQAIEHGWVVYGGDLSEAQILIQFAANTAAPKPLFQ